MYRFTLAVVMTCLAASYPQHVSAGAAADPEAARIIAELGLRAADKPISEHPRWRPRRIVVSLPESLSARVPGLEKQLKETAGEVELHFDRSEDFILSADVMAGTDAVISLCNAATMANASADLLWLHNYTVGIDRCLNLPEEQIAKRVFTNSKRLSGPAIAEHSMAMLWSLARGLPAYIRADEWDRAPAASVTFGELKGKTLLVAGLGGIGTQIAWRAHGLGMRVTAIRNSSRKGPEFVDYVGLSDELHALANKADVVINTLPLTEKTRGTFNRDFFEAIKPGAIFISVGRGKSTVTADLIAALESGKLYGAGLDVTDPEPLPANSPLWQMPNVIISPHVSAAGRGSTQRVAVIVNENLRRYIAGEPLLNVVDIRAGY